MAQTWPVGREPTADAFVRALRPRLVYRKRTKPEGKRSATAQRDRRRPRRSSRHHRHSVIALCSGTLKQMEARGK